VQQLVVRGMELRVLHQEQVRLVLGGMLRVVKWHLVVVVDLRQPRVVLGYSRFNSCLLLKISKTKHTFEALCHNHEHNRKTQYFDLPVFRIKERLIIVLFFM